MAKPAILGGKPAFAPGLKLVDISFSNYEFVFSRMREAMDSSLLTNNGMFVRQFEGALGKKVGVDCVAVANATLGLMLLYKAAGLRGKIIMPSFTFCATAHAAVWAGLEPVFVDIDPETFTIDPSAVEEAIDDKTSAIVGVHTFGNPCDIDRLSSIAKKHDVRLLFDSAHAFGSTYKGRAIGQFGDAEVFSTHATKTLITGEGGFVASADTRIIDYVKRARNFGFDDKNTDTLFCGMNAKMTEMSAILGLDILTGTHNAIEQKGKIAARFRSRLGKLPGISFQKVGSESYHSYCFFGMLIDPVDFGLDRDVLSRALAAENIMTRKYFYPPLHLHSSYKKYNFLKLPNTMNVSENVLCLPIHSKVSAKAADTICDAIETIHRHALDVRNARTD